jgi:hypothetical protein
MNQEREYARPRARIETLVDLIFGLSLSIGAVALITASPPASTSEINERILAFVFTASFVITTWMVYTYQMSVLPAETNSLTYLNVIMLILIAIIPYLLYNVEFTNLSLPAGDQSMIRDYASSLFAIDLTAILAILTTFSHIISIEEKRIVAPELARFFRQSRNVQGILAVITIASLAPFFWDLTLFAVPLRLYIWTIPVIVYWVRRSRLRPAEEPRPQ